MAPEIIITEERGVIRVELTPARVLAEKRSALFGVVGVAAFALLFSLRANSLQEAALLVFVLLFFVGLVAVWRARAWRAARRVPRLVAERGGEILIDGQPQGRVADVRAVLVFQDGEAEFGTHSVALRFEYSNLPVVGLEEADAHELGRRLAHFFRVDCTDGPTALKVVRAWIDRVRGR